MQTNTKFGQPRPNKYKEDIPDKFLWSDVNIQVSDLFKVHNTLSPKLVTIHQIWSAYMRYAQTRSQTDRRNNGQNDGVKTYSTPLTGQWWTNKFSTLQKS